MAKHTKLFSKKQELTKNFKRIVESSFE